MDVDERLDAIDRRLRLIEERLAIIDDPKSFSPVVSHEVADAVSSQEGSADSGALGLAGKALFVLGGAFLLRAATESTALPPQIGVLLGMLYAVGWSIAAAFAARAGRRLSAVFLIAVAAIVAYPIVWEAVTRFHVLSAITASLLLAAMSIALIVMARRFSLQWPAWIAVAGATFDALLLTYATREVIPFALALTLIGVVAFLLSMSYAGWLLAIESNLVAIFLIIAALIDESMDSRPAIVIALLLFAVIWTIAVARAPAQVAVASFIGLSGAAALVLPSSSLAILGGIAAVVAAEIARHSGWRSFAWQSAAWAMFSAVAGGLVVYAASAFLQNGGMVSVPWPVLATVALCVISFIRLEHARFLMLMIAVFGVTGFAVAIGSSLIDGSASTHALLRTAILSVIALALASIGRMWRAPEASQLAVLMLALTGVQVIVQDLLTGKAAVMFVALAIYGSAMLAMARLRKAPVAAPA